MKKQPPFWETGVNPILGYKYENFNLVKHVITREKRLKQRYERLINL